MTTSNLVPPIRTTPSKQQFLDAAQALRPELTDEQVGILWAQHAEETGEGINCYGWNLANTKHVDGDGHDYHVLHGVTEFINGKYINVAANDPSARFIAFTSLDSGMAHYIGMLSTQGRRYYPSWPFVLNCDPVGFAVTIGKCGWYTAPPTTYAKACVKKYAMWTKWLETTPKLISPVQPSDPITPTVPSIIYADPFPDEGKDEDS